MKLSEYIAALQTIMQDSGDLVVVGSYDFGEELADPPVVVQLCSGDFAVCDQKQADGQTVVRVG